MGKKSKEKAARREWFKSVAVAAPPEQTAQTAPTGLAASVRRMLSEHKPADALELLQRTPGEESLSTRRNLTALCLVRLGQYLPAYPLLLAALDENNVDLELNIGTFEVEANLELDAHLVRRARWLVRTYGLRSEVLADIHSNAQKRRDAIRQRAVDLGVDPACLEESLFWLESALLPLQSQEIEVAVEFFRKALVACPEFPWARYRLAMALLDLGRTEESLVHLQEVAKSGKNGASEALLAIVRIFVTTARRSEAEEWIDHFSGLPDSPAKRISEAQSNALLERHEAVRDLLRGARDLTLHERFLLGVANANLGNIPDARRELTEALDDDYTNGLVLVNLERLDLGRTDISYLGALEMLSFSTSALIKKVMLSSDSAAQETLRQLADADPSILEAIRQSLDEDPGFGLKLLSIFGSPEAITSLQAYAYDERRPTTERLQSLCYLRDAGEIAAKEPVEFVVDGHSYNIVLGGYTIVPDEPLQFPDQDRATLFEEGVRLLQNNPEASYEQWKTLDSQYPYMPRLRTHLARLSQSMGRLDQARLWAEKALELDANLLDAHVMIAGLNLALGNLKGALAESQIVGASRFVTVTEFLSFQQVREGMNLLLNTPMADALMAQAEMTADDESADANRELARLLGSMQKTMALTHHLRQRPVVTLHDTLSMAEIVQQMDPAVLYNAAWLFGLLPQIERLSRENDFSLDNEPYDEAQQDPTRLASIEKARKFLSSAMLDPAVLAEGLPGLPEHQFKGLIWLLEQSGRASLEDYLEAFPDGPSVASDMLLEYGIVAEGRLQGKLTLMIPVDLVGPLQEALRRIDTSA